MPSPPIQIFLTTIASQPALRQRQEYLLRILQVKKISFTSYDLASDETAKRLWKRKAPLDKQQLPGILVGGRFPGTFSDFEDAVECDDLAVFLRLNESYHAEIEGDTPAPPVQPIGVPGAASPLQMTPEHLKSKIFAPVASPLPGRKADVPIGGREGEFDISTELEGYGLQGVKVTEDELRDLVAELGLDGDDAGDLVKGLSNSDALEEQQRGFSDDKQTSVKESKFGDEEKLSATDVRSKDDLTAKEDVVAKENAKEDKLKPETKESEDFSQVSKTTEPES